MRRETRHRDSKNSDAISVIRSGIVTKSTKTMTEEQGLREEFYMFTPMMDKLGAVHPDTVWKWINKNYIPRKNAK